MTHCTLEKVRGTVGLWSFAHESMPPGRSGEVAARAESLGYAAYWIPESTGREALVSASLLTQATSSIVIGTAIASIWARDPVAAVNGARTLSATSDDRFVLGLGVSHKPLVEGLRGHRYEKPLEAMGDYLDAMGSVAMGSPEGSTEPAIMIAALGPKMLRLAAAKSLGAIPYLVTPEHTAFAREVMGADAFLVVEQAVALTDDDEEFALLATRHLEHYLELPNYVANLRRLGFDDSDVVRGGSPRLRDELVAHGDEGSIWARVDQHFLAGADHVCIQILGGGLSAPPFEDWERLSPARAER